MVVFSELRVTNDGGKLIIDTFIENTPGDENQKIDQIWLDNRAPVYVNGCPHPTDNAVLVASIDDEVYKEDIEKYQASIIDESLRKGYLTEVTYGRYSSISINSDMLHVYVITSGGESKECECTPTIGTVVNIYPYYQLSLYYMREMGESCVPPREFIDFLLKLKSVEIAIKVGNYDLAHQMWENLRRIKEFPTRSCKCAHNGVIS